MDEVRLNFECFDCPHECVCENIIIEYIDQRKNTAEWITDASECLKIIRDKKLVKKMKKQIEGYKDLLNIYEKEIHTLTMALKPIC